MSGKSEKWFYSVWSVLVALFLILGPLGLPLLWKSPRFSKWTKGLLTIAVLLYTVALVQAVRVSIQEAVRQIGVLQESLY